MTEEDLEPLPPLLPPEGLAASRLRDVAERVKTLGKGRLDLAGIRGSAGAAVAAAIARQGRRVVLVAADLDAARHAAEDIGFLARGALDDEAEDTGEGEVLVFAAQRVVPVRRREPRPPRRDEPHGDALPPRPRAPLVGAVRPRQRRWRARSSPARSWRSAPTSIVAEQELDRDALVRSLSEAGYLRVPVVEDPGSFAVRGALLDVWPPSSEMPVRVELYGELVLSMKPFDPVEQTTKKDAVELQAALARRPRARRSSTRARRPARASA